MSQKKMIEKSEVGRSGWYILVSECLLITSYDATCHIAMIIGRSFNVRTGQPMAGGILPDEEADYC